MSPKLRASSTPHCGKSAGMPHSTLGALPLVGRQIGDMHSGHRRHSVVRALRLSVPPKCLQPIERFTVTEKLFQFLPRQYLESITYCCTLIELGEADHQVDINLPKAPRGHLRQHLSVLH